MVFGGTNLDMTKNNSTMTYNQEYESMIDLIQSTIKEALGFEPTVLPAKETGGADAALYKNQQRRLYLIRPNDITDMPHSARAAQVIIE